MSGKGEHDICRSLVTCARNDALRAGLPERILNRARNIGITGGRRSHFVEFVDNGLGERKVFHFRACCRYAALADAIQKVADQYVARGTFRCRWCRQDKPAKYRTTIGSSKQAVCLTCYADLTHD